MAGPAPETKPNEPTEAQKKDETMGWQIMKRGDDPALGPYRADGSRGARRWNPTSGQYEGEYKAEGSTAPSSSAPLAVNPVPGQSATPPPAATPEPGNVPVALDGPTSKARKLITSDQHWTEAWTVEDLKYTTYYSTIWEVFEEMTYRHPGYVKHPRIYYRSNRMTMFFGFPDQDMWESMGDPSSIFEANRLFLEMAMMSKVVDKRNVEVPNSSFSETENVRQMAGEKGVTLQGIRSSPSLEGASKSISLSVYKMLEQTNGKGFNLVVNANLASKFIKTVRNRFRPFRRWHNVNSYTDIINNTIEATADGWFTQVSVQFGGTSITDDVATDSFNKSSAGTENPNIFVSWNDDNIVTRNACIDLSPAYLRSTHYQFVNIKREAMAKRYARSLLAKQAKEMYKGSLLIMGNPHIRPYDVIMVNDTYSNICGPIEVEEVHHMFGADTGFITHIYPDTLVVNDDVTPYMLHNGLYNEAWMKTELYASNAMAQRPVYGDTDGLVSNSVAARQLKKLFNSYDQQVEKIKYEMDIVSKLWDNDSWTGDLRFAAGALSGGAAGLALAANGLAGINLIRSIPKIGTLLTGSGWKGGLTFSLITSIGIGGYAFSKFGSQFQSFVMNFVADSRAYFIIPLMKEGVPMVAGINIGFGSGIYKTPLQYMKQYFMDGGMGLATKEIDQLMENSEIRAKYGANLSWWLMMEKSLETFKDHWDLTFMNFGAKMGEMAGAIAAIDPAKNAKIGDSLVEYTEVQEYFDESPQSPDIASGGSSTYEKVLAPVTTGGTK